MIPPSQIAAASSKLIGAGMCARAALSRAQTYSAWAPDLMPKTSSPASNLVTAAPTPSTTPESSLPRIGRSRPQEAGEDAREERVRCARKPQSDRFTVVATIRMRISSSFGTGLSTSASRRTSGGPYLSWTTALMP